jgi:hypothetical protein
VKFRPLVLNVSLALLYGLVYVECYVSFLNGNFEYVGYDLFHRESWFLVASIAIAVLPVFFYRGFRAVSSAIAVLVYLVLYVPIVLTFALGSSKPVGEIAVVQLTFMTAMAVLFLADAVVIRNPLKLDIGVNLMPAVLGVTALSTMYILFVYRGSLRFASFGGDLYLQREANTSLGAGLVTRYLSSWLFTVFVPLCLAFGLSSRRYRYTIGGALACLILYMATANKLMILLPLIYLSMYLLLRERLSATLPLLTAALSLLIGGLIAVAKLGGAAFVAAAIVLNRTIGNGGQLTMAYYDFFSFHERTGYSHVSGFNLFTGAYPYGDLGVGQVVGQFYWSPVMNANANFWATDGIAATGLPGVLVIGVAAALLFVVINSVTQRYDRLFSVLCFLAFVTMLLNESLFSSLWSGGAFFLILYFAFNRRSSGSAPGHAPLRAIAAPTWNGVGDRPTASSPIG